MRISDWSSDVCSSDLVGRVRERGITAFGSQQECVCYHIALIFQLPRRPMEIADQRVVSMHYTLTNAQGDVIDSSQGNEPLVYLHGGGNIIRSEEHTSELQSLMRISYAVFCLKKKKEYL